MKIRPEEWFSIGTGILCGSLVLARSPVTGGFWPNLGVELMVVATATIATLAMNRLVLDRLPNG